MRDRRVALALAAILLGVSTVACGGTSSTRDEGITVSKPGNHGYQGVYLDKPYDVASVALQSDRGDQVDLSTLTGINLVFFGYTKCPDVCQTVMSTIASALARLPKADQSKVHVYLVTTDPPRDTTEVLREYLDRFNPDFIGLTGSMPDLVAAGKPLGVEIEKGQKLPGGGYDVNHGTHTFVVTDGRVPLLWTAATSPAEMSTDLIRLLKASK